MAMENPRIGFIGVGQMGAPMVHCLLDAGYPVTVLEHRNRAPVEAVLAAGASEALEPIALAEACGVIILCVSNSEAVCETVEALKPALRKGTVIVDASTSDPALTRKLAAELQQLGVALVDAPLTGGVAQAEAGELGILLGGDEAACAAVRPVLESFAKRIERFGPAGAGHTAKLVNNYLVCGMVSLIAETYNVARDLSIDWASLYAVMQQGSNNSGALQRIVENALAGDFDGYKFSIANARKDMAYFCALEDQLNGPGGPTALAEAVLNTYDEAIEKGHGDKMVSRLIDPELNGQAPKKETPKT